jgi:hypothetical protein
MGVLRGLSLVVVALIGVLIGAAIFLVIGLFAISPPTISSAAPGQPWDVTLDITEAFLTTQLNTPRASSSTSSAPVPVQLTNAKAEMNADGTITITGNAGLAGGGAAPSSTRLPINPSGAVAVQVTLRPSVTDGALSTEVITAQVGPLSVDSFGSLIEDQINNQITNSLNSQSFTITELTVRDGAMLVRAKQTGQ